MELKLTRYHIIAVNFALIAAIAYFAASAVNSIIKLRLTPAPAAPPMRMQMSAFSGIHPRLYYDLIVKRDIFNLVPQVVAAPVATSTDLHIRLLGTSLRMREKPFAIIEDQAGNEDVYKVGDQIPDAGELVAVEKNRAIILHDAQRVALELPKDEMPAPSAPVMTGLMGRPGFKLTPGAFRRFHPPGMPAAAAPSDSNDDNDDEPDVDVDETSPDHYSLQRSQVRDALQHSAQLMSEIHAVPNVQNGKTDGLSLTDVASGSVFEDLGLEDGDVLTAVDGRPIQNPAEAIGLFGSLATRSSVNLTVTRDGSPVTLHYTIH